MTGAAKAGPAMAAARGLLAAGNSTNEPCVCCYNDVSNKSTDRAVGGPGPLRFCSRLGMQLRILPDSRVSPQKSLLFRSLLFRVGFLCSVVDSESRTGQA